MPKGFPRFKLQEFPAALWKRVVAYLIDSLVLSVVVASPFQNFFMGMEKHGFSYYFTRFEVTGKITLVVFAIAALMLIYWAFMEFRFSQTIGKIIMKIHVHSLKGNLTLRQCIMRNITKISSILLLVDCIHIYTSKTHQRWLEKVSNTEVVEALQLPLQASLRKTREAISI
ncbi:MAG: RDD family protein [Nanoarchaeota archaeon]|nr:RDD family protein [Nanoarchaeota archaeon]